MEYDSTLPYDSLHIYDDTFELWYLGDDPVIAGYLGDTQVYPPKFQEGGQEGGKPSDGVYVMEAGWNLGIEQSMYPGMNRVGVTTVDMDGINYFYFSKTKSSYGAFTEANIKEGEWFLVSNEDARYYGVFTGSTYDDGSVIGARCELIESYGEFIPGKQEFVILGYFAEFRQPGDDRVIVSNALKDM